jgi:hypothetical protein
MHHGLVGIQIRVHISQIQKERNSHVRTRSNISSVKNSDVDDHPVASLAITAETEYRSLMSDLGPVGIVATHGVQDVCRSLRVV